MKHHQPSSSSSSSSSLLSPSRRKTTQDRPQWRSMPYYLALFVVFCCIFNYVFLTSQHYWTVVQESQQLQDHPHVEGGGGGGDGAAGVPHPAPKGSPAAATIAAADGSSTKLLSDYQQKQRVLQLKNTPEEASLVLQQRKKWRASNNITNKPASYYSQNVTKLLKNQQTLLLNTKKNPDSSNNATTTTKLKLQPTFSMKEIASAYSNTVKQLKLITMKHVDALQSQPQPTKPKKKKKKKKVVDPFVYPELVDPLVIFHTYAPSRIPGYLKFSHNNTNITNANNMTNATTTTTTVEGVKTLFGYVMRDLASRVLDHRLLTILGSSTLSSNVLVVSPQATQIVANLKQRYVTTTTTGNRMTVHDEDVLRKEIGYEVGGSFLLRAHREQHTYYGFDSTTGAHLENHWWNHSFSSNLQLAQKPNHLRLAVLDHGFHNDRILVNAVDFLHDSNTQYIIVGFGVFPQESLLLENSTVATTNNYTNYGQDAIAKLLAFHYKVQLLSISHSMPDVDGVEDVMRPNLRLDRRHRALFFQILQSRSNNEGDGVPIMGYVFATKGLDLAIPTAMAYKPAMTTDQGVTYKRCKGTNLNVQFAAANRRRRKYESNVALSVTCLGLRVQTSITKNRDFKQVWFSGATIESSEAACVRVVCDETEQVACVSRILVSNTTGNETVLTTTADGTVHKHFTERNQTMEGPSRKPNILILKVNPISRARFKRSLVKTHELLQRLNFTSFDRFTAVGLPDDLLGGSGVTPTLVTAHTLRKREEALWGSLQDHGYATLKAKDQCVDEDIAYRAQREAPDSQPEHGEALQKMLCFNFRPPNCLGSKAAARHLLDYGDHFINTYEHHNQSWAAMLEFVDSREDTQMLEGTLDDPIWEFLYPIYQAQASVPRSVWDNTLIVVMSETGLHYGSYSLSPRGRKEIAQPMLHMHLPKTIDVTPGVLDGNSKKWTTPFDLQATIFDFLHMPDSPSLATPSGEDMVSDIPSSLFQPLSTHRNECLTSTSIPSKICVLLLHNDSATLMMPNPPSVLSFFADIPPRHKQRTPLCIPKQSTKVFSTNSTSKCVCATNIRPWYECSKHPIDNNSNSTVEETFSMIDCNEARIFEVKVQRNPEVLNRQPQLPADAPSQPHQSPNILLLEVDSVATAYADRHFPRTRELLNSFRLRSSTEDASGYACNFNETFCAAEFDAFSVVGSNSIPNQIAAFGGCIVTAGPEQCAILTEDGKNRTICTDSSHQAYTMELVNQHRSSTTFCQVDDLTRSPWIFDIAKTAGYVTLFAEEFCYRDSMWVPQGNMFPLKADITPSEFFCRIAERRATKQGEKMVLPAFHYGYDPSPGQPLCVDEHGGYESGRVSFDHIESMWDAYPEVPKLAYLNAIAAHYYQDFKSMADRSEAYDSLLASFLKRMLARPDMANTIIVIRADHGLQSGPVTPDYSIQQEALRPWTEIVVPKNLSGLSLETLFNNQQKLATGFDLYNTIVNSITGSNHLIAPEVPEWTHHLWKEAIPSSRTCADAKVRAEYCLFESERIFTAPNLGTCNLAEEEQSLVCPHLDGNFSTQMGAVVSAVFHTTEHIQPRVCPSAFAEATTIAPSLAESWRQIDKINNDTDLPVKARQGAMLRTFSAELATAIHTSDVRPFNLCMGGLGSGHTAALFLDAVPTLILHLFDNVTQSSSSSPRNSILQSLENQFGQVRFALYPGASITTTTAIVPNDVQCDFIYSTNRTSLAMIQDAPCGILVATESRTSLHDHHLYFGTPSSMWSQLRKNNCVKDITCFTEGKSQLVLQNAVVTVEHKFCIGVTTGQCQRSLPDSEHAKKKVQQEQCDSKIAQATRNSIVLNHVCPLHEAVIPRPPNDLRALTKGILQNEPEKVSSSGTRKHKLVLAPLLQ